MKRVNKKAFRDYLQKALVGEVGDFIQNKAQAILAEDLLVQSVDLVKVRGIDEYDIIVSVDDIESSMMVLRDLIEYVCIAQGVKYRKIVVEL